jgi:hypothetical protein
LLSALAACSSANNVAPPDAAEPPGRCSGDRLCVGSSLRACTDGTVGDEIDSCASTGACSLNRCTSPACAEAERDRTSFVGCVFYTAEVDNVASDAAAPTSFLVTNPGPEPAHVELWRRVGGSWTSTVVDTADPGAAVRLTIAGLEIKESGPSANNGLRVVSTQPVTVAQIQSDDSHNEALSSGGAIVLPVQALGRRHLVMTYQQAQTPALAATDNSLGGAGRFIIVGTAPATHVTLTLTDNASLVIAGVLATVPRESVYELDIGEGEVFQAWSGDDKQDLSGTEIATTQPVAVFAGNIATTYGRIMAPNTINSPDMVHEQIPPIASWSYKYVAAVMPPQSGTCDPLIGPPGASLWRLLAAVPDTDVQFTGPDPSRPVHANVTMGAGAVIEFVADTDFVVSANGPLLLTQGIDCEPSLSLGISADRLLQDVTFSVLPSFDQMIAVARLGKEQVLFDGAPLNSALFKPAGGGYEVARVPLDKCLPSAQVCTHRLQGRFGMTLRGMDVFASYVMTMPSWTGCIDPLDPTCVN